VSTPGRGRIPRLSRRSSSSRRLQLPVAGRRCAGVLLQTPFCHSVFDAVAQSGARRDTGAVATGGANLGEVGAARRGVGVPLHGGVGGAQFLHLHRGMAEPAVDIGEARREIALAVLAGGLVRPRCRGPKATGGTVASAAPAVGPRAAPAVPAAMAVAPRPTGRPPSPPAGPAAMAATPGPPVPAGPAETPEPGPCSERTRTAPTAPPAPTAPARFRHDRHPRPPVKNHTVGPSSPPGIRKGYLVPRV